jgi:FAD/FMN-containing dehydrogenase
MQVAGLPLERLTGFGRARFAVSRVLRPSHREDLEALFEHVVPELRTLALRGAGRSYGDAALNDGGAVLDTSGLRRVLAWDPQRGIADVEPGVTVRELCRMALRDGWWPPVVPGTMHATLGGCVAANVHGKNALRAGTLGEHVRELELLLPDGRRALAAPDGDAELFRAVVGGMGWLGCIVRIRLALRRVHSGCVRVRALPARHFAELVARFDAAPDAEHVVGWCDALAGGAALGRGVVHAAWELGPGEGPPLAQAAASGAQELPARLLGVLPRAWAARGLRAFASSAAMRALNAAKARLHALGGERSELESHARFAFLLDFVPGWERAYGAGGLVQIQPFVPRDAGAHALPAMLRAAQRLGLPPFLAVLKRHRADPFLLSPALDGYSLALDFPARRQAALAAVAREIHAIALDCGGRFYLAKDATLTHDEWRRSLPAESLRRFADQKRKCDPDGRLQTDQSRRLLPELHATR